LVEEVDVDLAELFREGKGVLRHRVFTKNSGSVKLFP
jgi:hypothetical protein